MLAARGSAPSSSLRQAMMWARVTPRTSTGRRRRVNAENSSTSPYRPGGFWVGEVGEPTRDSGGTSARLAILGRSQGPLINRNQVLRHARTSPCPAVFLTREWILSG